MKTTYQVTRLFLTGTLAGLTYTEETSVRFELGATYRECCGGRSLYLITDVVEIIQQA